MRRVAAVAVVLAGVGLCAWLLWPAKPLSGEEAVRAVIADIAAKAEKKDPSGIVEHVSERYRGEAGDRQELKRYLAAYILRSDWVSVVTANVKVALEGDKAHVSLAVLLARSPAKTAAQAQEALVGSHYIEADLEREGAEWKIVAATRREASAADWL